MSCTRVMFLSILTILLLAGNAESADQRNTSCLKEKFNLISVLDLDMFSFETAALLESGDTAAAEDLIRSYFMKKKISCVFSSLGRCTDAVARADGILLNRYRFWIYDEYELPEDLMWNEDPPNSRNWTYYLLSFEFLWILNEAYKETGNTEYLEKGRILIEDFSQDNLDRFSLPSRNAWYDHPAANRLVYLVDFWFLYNSACEATPEFTSLLLELIWRHARFLQTPDNYNPKTNHGLFNCLALERVAFAFPEMVESDDFLAFSLARFEKQLEDNFDRDGVHREYSPWYQIWIAGLLNVYADDCRYNDVQLPDTSIQAIEKIVGICVNFFHPDWTVALFGDSDLYLTEKMMGPVMESHPWLEYISTKGHKGEMPASSSVAFTDSHIYIMRSGWGEMRPCQDESCMMAFFTPSALNHDHEDLFEFELYAGGVKWITDLGRYNYNYLTEERKYIVSAEAHNGIIPYRLVTQQEFRAGKAPITEGSRNKPKNEGFVPKDTSSISDRSNLESAINRISLETEPDKKVDLYKRLLKDAEGDDAIRIKFAIAFVVAEELGDNREAAAYLNDIIRDSKDEEHIALARQYLSVMDGDQDELLKSDESSEREISSVERKADLYTSRPEIERNIEIKTIRKEVKYPSGMGPKVLSWISNTRFDYLEGQMRYEREYLRHGRAILFIKPFYYLVVDRFSSKKKMLIKQLFHFAPDVSVTSKGKFDYILKSPSGRSCIMKGSCLVSEIEEKIIRGQTEPEFQGWYSGMFGEFVPADALQNHILFLDEAYAIYLFVPTGQRSPSAFQVSIDDSDLKRSSGSPGGRLRIAIETPRERIKIDYTPTPEFLDNGATEGGDPSISIRKTRK